MKIFLSLLSVLALLGAAAAVYAGLSVKDYLSPGPLAEEKIVLIERGSGVSTIAAKLEAEGVIENPFIFKIAARLTEKHSSLKAGEYQFVSSISMADVDRTSVV